MKQIDLEKFDLTALPSIPLEKRKALPASPGIYFVFTSFGELAYIGRAASLRMRWQTHHRLQELRRIPHARIAWFACKDVEDLPALESTFIALCQPQLNGTRCSYNPFGNHAMGHEQILRRTAQVCARFFASSPAFFRRKV